MDKDHGKMPLYGLKLLTGKFCWLSYFKVALQPITKISACHLSLFEC